MGFFGKIKDNLNHGGIKLDLQAASSVSMQDAAFPVVVTLTSTSPEQHSVKRVSAEIIATNRQQSYNQPVANGSGSSMPQTLAQTVARAENNEPFIIMPGETKTLQFNIVMNAGAAAEAQFEEGSAMAQVAGAFKNLQSVSAALDNTSWSYSLKASADVEGIALDPSVSHILQILKPGEMGGGFAGIQKSL